LDTATVVQVAFFARGLKPLVLNRTNWEKIADISGSDESDDWAGTKVELYATTTSMNGKIIDCVRVRAPGEAQEKPKKSRLFSRRRTTKPSRSSTTKCQSLREATAMLSHALKLAERGLAVFPCRVRDKVPCTVHGCSDATRDADRICAWWRENENFNIGIATGAPSRVFVVDVDDDGGEHALLKLRVLPNTVEAITARGRHVYFRMPATGDIRNSAGKIAPHIDVRGTGGYVLAPPSIHPSGRRYCWSVDSAHTLANAPTWLLERLTDTPQRRVDPAALKGDVQEGQRNDRIARLAGHLLRHRVHPHMATELLLAWNMQHCLPPLSDNEVLQTIDSIANCEARRRGKR
jgi:hypothetical protein